MNLSIRLLFLASLCSSLISCIASPSPTQVATLPPTIEPNLTVTTRSTAQSDVQLVAGQWNYLFYHPVLKKIVLVNGGPDRGKSKDDPLQLWTWEGTSWSLLSADPQGPAWRNFAGAAFDSTRNRLVLHGGVQDRNSRMQETWEWDGQAWTKFNVPGPGYREGAVMAYDAARGKTILFGGANEKFEILGDTWEWDGAQWTQVSTTGPAPRFPSAIVYDAARQKVLLFGGHFVNDASYTNFDDLWAWDGASWQEIRLEGEKPGVRNIAQMVFNPVTEKVWLLGGGEESFPGDLWTWDGTSLTQLLPSGAPARSGPGAAYNPERDRLVVFGGVDRPGGTAVTDTWEWDGQTWTCVYGCQ